MCIKQNIYKHVWKMILYCPNWMGRSANEDDTDYIRSSITPALVLLVTVVIFVKK